MEMGQRVRTLDGSLGIVVAISGALARVCYLAPNDQLSYITDTHLVSFLQPMPLPQSDRHDASLCH